MITVEPNKQMKSYVLVHSDGSQEQVYISEPLANGKASAREHVVMAYFLVGTLVLAMTAYLNYRQIKKK